MIRNKRAPTAVQNGTFEISQASSPRYPPIYVAFFTTSHRKKFLTILCFSILGAVSDHQTQKGLRLGSRMLA